MFEKSCSKLTTFSSYFFKFINKMMTFRFNRLNEIFHNWHKKVNFILGYWMEQDCVLTSISFFQKLIFCSECNYKFLACFYHYEYLANYLEFSITFAGDVIGKRKKKRPLIYSQSLGLMKIFFSKCISFKLLHSHIWKYIFSVILSYNSTFSCFLWTSFLRFSTLFSQTKGISWLYVYIYIAKM